MKTVLITGATSGIGEALCCHYQALGYAVIACGRQPEKLAALAGYSNVSTISVDLCDEQQVMQKMGQLGSLDIVILNAGSCEYMDDVKHFALQNMSLIKTKPEHRILFKVVSTMTALHTYNSRQDIQSIQVSFQDMKLITSFCY